MSIESEFYSRIEEGVRDWVRILRNAGINTECSCGHEGYIQCQTLDPTDDIEKIKIVLREHKIEGFSIEYHYDEWPDHTTWPRWRQFIEIRSKDFKARLSGSATGHPSP